MILCAKCKKKPDFVKETTLVTDHRIDVTVECHGKSETRSLTREELLKAEKSELLFFSPAAAEAQPKRKVGPGTLGREGHVRGSKGAGS